MRRSRKNRFPILEMLERQWAVGRAIHRFRPDVVASLMGSYVQSARLFGVRNVIFTDTETQAFNHKIAHPFADEIYTPDCFLKDLGPKHRRYNGLHELTYLHPDYFTPEAAVIEKYEGLKPGNYIVIRMSAWNTFHDRDRKGIGEGIYPFIERFEKDYQIVLSAEENKVPPGMEKFVREFPPEDFHHLLGHARFVLTEGASTASEAACLGVPSVFINSVGELGNFVLLTKKFPLVQSYQSGEGGIPKAIEWLERLSIGADPEFDRNYLSFTNAQEDVGNYVIGVLTSKATSGKSVKTV